MIIEMTDEHYETIIDALYFERRQVRSFLREHPDPHGTAQKELDAVEDVLLHLDEQ